MSYCEKQVRRGEMSKPKDPMNRLKNRHDRKKKTEIKEIAAIWMDRQGFDKEKWVLVKS